MTVGYSIYNKAVWHGCFHWFAGQVVGYGWVGVVWRQVVHWVAWLAGDLVTDFKETRQLQLVSRQRRERLQNHQTFTPAENDAFCSSGEGDKITSPTYEFLSNFNSENLTGAKFG